MIEFTAPLIDLILIGVALEFAGLAIWLRRRGDHHLVTPTLFFLASGGALMVALRFALASDQKSLIAFPMLAALFLHGTFLAILIRRFNGSDR